MRFGFAFGTASFVTASLCEPSSADFHPLEMRVADLITKKRDGLDLTDEEIRAFVRLLVDGRMEDSQLGTLRNLFFKFYSTN